MLIGEHRDRLADHVLQLEIIRYLHALNPSLAIGVTCFEQPFQSVLDDYIAQHITEQQLLADAEYFSRWGRDYRLYAPILRYARAHALPLVALSVPSDMHRAVATAGIASLSEDDRGSVPDEMDDDVPGYRERVLSDLAADGPMMPQDATFLLAAEMLSDESMAHRAAAYLREHPARQMVMLADVSRLAYRSGVPVRLEQRISSPVVTVLPVSADQGYPADAADYRLATDEMMQLPPRGRMGMRLQDTPGGVFVQRVRRGSGADQAGMAEGDYLRAINGRDIATLEQLQVQMWYRVPGETLTLTIERVAAGVAVMRELMLTLGP
ncbi:MAG TPA: iron-regulated protein [Gammaproteobacteria bacterium]|nr:iron-regulated protein [Gammaproteobacteria bacterium]